MPADAADPTPCHLEQLDRSPQPGDIGGQFPFHGLAAQMVTVGGSARRDGPVTGVEQVPHRLGYRVWSVSAAVAMTVRPRGRRGPARCAAGCGLGAGPAAPAAHPPRVRCAPGPLPPPPCRRNTHRSTSVRRSSRRGPCPGSALPRHGMGGVSGRPFGGVHGYRIAMGDVLGQVTGRVTAETLDITSPTRSHPRERLSGREFDALFVIAGTTTAEGHPDRRGVD